MNHTDYAETYAHSAESEDYSSIPVRYAAPTPAQISHIVGHGYLIDTEAMERGVQTIICPVSGMRFSSAANSWRYLCQLIRDYMLCDTCGDPDYHAPAND